MDAALRGELEALLTCTYHLNTVSEQSVLCYCSKCLRGCRNRNLFERALSDSWVHRGTSYDHWADGFGTEESVPVQPLLAGGQSKRRYTVRAVRTACHNRIATLQRLLAPENRTLPGGSAALRQPTAPSHPPQPVQDVQPLEYIKDCRYCVGRYADTVEHYYDKQTLEQRQPGKDGSTIYTSEGDADDVGKLLHKECCCSQLWTSRQIPIAT